MAIAVMQGRLVPPEGDRFQSFPRNQWRREFSRAAEAGLDAIEWIYDTYGEGENPLEDDKGTSELRSLQERHGIAVQSVCADYFMEHPLLRGSSGGREHFVERLLWLLHRCERAGIRRIVLPFVDRAKIDSDAAAVQVIEALTSVAADAARRQIELHLETSLPPVGFAALMDRLPGPVFKVNYDSGNSASLGFVVDQEFAAFGERIGSVHVKDRVLGGGTVPLGSGDADLTAMFRCLARVGYSGDYVLQVARGEPGHELELIQSNVILVKQHIDRDMMGRPCP
jgi:hexulose-6-phosphate isomerase